MLREREEKRPTDGGNGRTSRGGVEGKREGENAAAVVAEQKPVVEEETVARIQGVVGSGDDGNLRRFGG